MQWLEKYIATAEKILSVYDGAMPLQHYLKNYFSQNKKHGSRDRKTITHLCYTYFRAGKALTALSFRERLLAALYLCENDPSKWKSLFSKEFVDNHSPVLEERIKFIANIYPGFSVKNIFPFEDEMSFAGESFARSFLVQPKTFLRIRPGRSKTVTDALTRASIPFEHDGGAIALESAVNIAGILKLNADAVVQDSSSQKTGDLLLPLKQENTCTVWDCCAASGGKSILAFDVLKPIRLTVSDVRPSIIHNLKKRLREARVPVEKMFKADLTKPVDPGCKFELIICDVPCTGSGTWARTPEQLYFFNREKIDVYASLQKSIVQHVLPHLAEDGYLLYSTCSVFIKENEDAVRFIQQAFPFMELIQQQSIRGYHQRADTLFAALLKKRKI